MNNNNLKEKWLTYTENSPMIQNGVDILRTIESLGFSAYIAGGSVRDLVMGLEPYDIDIATNCPVETLETRFNTHDIGQSKDFGIVCIQSGGFNFEIAQFREDGDYSDGRRPDSVQLCEEFKGDASRRDLTMNAMGVDKDGNILDFFGGVQSIQNKLIRTVGNPNDRFSEDYLRMLRVIRFAGKLDFDIDQETRESIELHKSQLTLLSPERIKDELWKMASQSGHKFANTIILMDELGVLDVILPEVSRMKNTLETPRHHPEAYIEGCGRVFDHVMCALRQSESKDPVVNMAVLLHDVGKPETHQLKIDSKGERHSYFGHAEVSGEIIEVIAERLKLSRKERNSIIFAAVNHMKLFRGKEMKPSKIVKIVGDENWGVLKSVSFCDDACRTGLFDRSKFDQAIDEMEQISHKWNTREDGKPPKVLDGNRVLDLTGLKPSKLVGDIVRAVSEDIINKSIGCDNEIDNLIKKYHEELR